MNEFGEHCIEGFDLGIERLDASGMATHCHLGCVQDRVRTLTRPQLCDLCHETGFGTALEPGTNRIWCSEYEMA